MKELTTSVASQKTREEKNELKLPWGFIAIRNFLFCILDSLKIRMVNPLGDMAYQDRKVAFTKESFMLLSIYHSVVCLGIDFELKENNGHNSFFHHQPN